MRSATLLLFLLAARALHAQPEPDEYFTVTVSALPEAYKTTVFGDKINVRKAPLTDAPVVAQLHAGDAVEVTGADTTALSLNGWTAFWRKIAFTQDGKRTEGYVWGGLLSIMPLKAADASFVYNITKTKVIKHKDPDGSIYETSVNEVELRALQNGQITGSARVEMYFDPATYESRAFVYNALGVPGYKNLVKLEFLFPACGYTSYDFWCLWDGKTLTPLPLLSSFADAGTVAEIETYIFPGVEGGVEGKILYLYELSEGLEMEGEYDYQKNIRPLIWDGKKFKKPEIPK